MEDDIPATPLVDEGGVEAALAATPVGSALPAVDDAAEPFGSLGPAPATPRVLTLSEQVLWVIANNTPDRVGGKALRDGFDHYLGGGGGKTDGPSKEGLFLQAVKEAFEENKSLKDSNRGLRGEVEDLNGTVRKLLEKLKLLHCSSEEAKEEHGDLLCEVLEYILDNLASEEDEGDGEGEGEEEGEEEGDGGEEGGGGQTPNRDLRAQIARDAAETPRPELREQIKDLRQQLASATASASEESIRASDESIRLKELVKGYKKQLFDKDAAIIALRNTIQV